MLDSKALEGEFTHDHFVGAYNPNFVKGSALEGYREKYTQLTDVRLKRNGAASTAIGEAGRGTANSWDGVGTMPANAERVVLRIEAPRESVLSLPVFGDNKQKEQEVVLTGNKYRWDAWKGRAPSLKAVPMGGARPEDRPTEDKK
jgi:hypothetical protein